METKEIEEAPEQEFTSNHTQKNRLWDVSREAQNGLTEFFTKLEVSLSFEGFLK